MVVGPAPTGPRAQRRPCGAAKLARLSRLLPEPHPPSPGSGSGGAAGGPPAAGAQAGVDGQLPGSCSDACAPSAAADMGSFARLRDGLARVDEAAASAATARAAAPMDDKQQTGVGSAAAGAAPFEVELQAGVGNAAVGEAPMEVERQAGVGNAAVGAAPMKVVRQAGMGNAAPAASPMDAARQAGVDDAAPAAAPHATSPPATPRYPPGGLHTDMNVDGPSQAPSPVPVLVPEAPGGWQHMQPAPVVPVDVMPVRSAEEHVERVLELLQGAGLGATAVADGSCAAEAMPVSVALQVLSWASATAANLGAAAVKARYRELCVVLHPDKNSHARAADAFSALGKALVVVMAAIDGPRVWQDEGTGCVDDELFRMDADGTISIKGAPTDGAAGSGGRRALALPDAWSCVPPAAAASKQRRSVFALALRSRGDLLALCGRRAARWPLSPSGAPDGAGTGTPPCLVLFVAQRASAAVARGGGGGCAAGGQLLWELMSRRAVEAAVEAAAAAVAEVEVEVEAARGPGGCLPPAPDEATEGCVLGGMFEPRAGPDGVPRGPVREAGSAISLGSKATAGGGPVSAAPPQLRAMLLLPVFTACQGAFPLNGTYFQTNEMFLDAGTLAEPVAVPWGPLLRMRAAEREQTDDNSAPAGPPEGELSAHWHRTHFGFSTASITRGMGLTQSHHTLEAPTHATAHAHSWRVTVRLPPHRKRAIGASSAMRSRQRLSWLACAVFAALIGLAQAQSSNKVSTDCVAQLVRDVLLATTSKNNTSAEDKYSDVLEVVNGFVERCTGGYSDSKGLRPLRILGPRQAAGDIPQVVADFTAHTGYKVIVELVDPIEIVSELMFVEQTSPLTYDGWFADGSAVVDLVTNTGLIAPLDAFIKRDSSILWSDVTEYVREITSTYNGSKIGVPIGGKPLSLVYRRDVFAAANISAPNTWEDVILAAQILNSTDFNADGIIDYSLCWQLADCPWDGTIAVSAILATMTQTAGPQSGFLWDPQTMVSLGGTAAMTRTMELIQELLPYSATSCEVLNPHFMQGSCVVTIALESLFKGVSFFTPMKGVIGTAMMPGSTRVLNRQTGRLEECTSALCPHAVLERTYDGSEVLVNRAPHFGMGGFSGFVNAQQDEAHQQAMYAFWSFMSEPVYSKHLVMTSAVVGPYRKSHLDTSAPSLAAWSAIGYDELAVKDFLMTVKDSLEHANFVPDVRMLNGYRYLGTLYTALSNASAGMAPAQITANVLAEHTAILASSGPRAVVQQTLRAGLGISVALPQEVVDTKTGPTTKTDAQAGDNDRQLAIILGVTIPLAVILSVLMIARLIMLYRKRSLFGGRWVPSPGEDTTLVVTDIMESTALWETLGPGVMECAVATHNAVVREVLAKWSGYEQATEGDSFLLVFQTPSDALAFAMQLQTSLLEAAWEPQLLQHPICTHMKMWPSAALQSASNNDGRSALLRAAAVLAPGEASAHGLGAFYSPSIVSGDFGTWDDAQTLLAPSRSPSTLAAASRVVQSHMMVHRRSIDRSATAAALPLDEHGGSNGLSHIDGFAAEAMMGERDPASTCHLSKARELLKSLHLAVVGGGLSRVGSSASLSSSMPRGDAPATSTMAKCMRLAWTSESSPAAEAAVKSQVTLFKGLRVRIGMHSGVESGDVERNITSGRMVVGGAPLQLAKAVGDAGAGGMVLMTQETFERLHPDRARNGVIMLALGEHGLTDNSLGTVCVYQAIEQSLAPRLAAFEPLRGLSEMETGTMDAPIGTITIAFSNMVGLTTLQAWDKDRANVALDAYAAVSKQLLYDAGGYLVELTSSGLCLAAFRHPLDAIAWGTGLIEVMKHRQWDEELLSHELCDEVLLHEPVCKGGSTPLHSRVLFRGPRIKIGIDVGKVQADASPVTGRMTYRGKVMNRAARISGKVGRRVCC
ncbi:hypothetical protein FOA52_015893 [Chlamydomonas sp. UWO 241]|nr:hypothetical protein FOA52_015893 [Chlamydomonas sp. UWO 241]